MSKKTLKDIYRKEFQKSKVFLYPTLDIKRGTSITPIETYVSWEGKFAPTDHRLIALFHLRDDREFANFEQHKLTGNKYYEDICEVNGNKALYIFNFEELSDDFDNFLKGKYSKLSITMKNNIKRFYGANSSSYAYIESWLYPEKFMDNYAKILYSPEDRMEGKRILNEVGELCSKPDYNKELVDLSPVVVEL